jgi:hypothetical protein
LKIENYSKTISDTEDKIKILNENKKENIESEKNEISYEIKIVIDEQNNKINNFNKIIFDLENRIKNSNLNEYGIDNFPSLSRNNLNLSAFRKFLKIENFNS